MSSFNYDISTNRALSTLDIFERKKGSVPELYTTNIDFSFEMMRT